jgi:hypothetical protein
VRQGEHLILPADSPEAKQAFKLQEAANGPQETTNQEGSGQEAS